ncbi:hypothetical protein [Jidongwangia harbinensis]|uniref:hypothetical protein n=1 Tax=Jidongwangia harbinensis TaxID=2878561 RepID=UPI001CD93AE2|nr:hypothetical protein [Jidongwangia harbinensis]MCA2214001.1 hypothetical protein [Jidongwangia harbinensis]
MRIIGGEMETWSDLAGRPGPVRATVPPEVLAAVGGRTLIAGPHHPDLIDTVPADDLTVLVRGLPDAEALTRRYAGRPGVTVLCGSPEKLAGEPPFDTVLALDGLDRLPSVEGADLSWSDTLEVLRSVRRPGALFVLGMANPMGLDRLVALPADPGDAAWVRGGDESRPRDLGALRERLGDVVAAYAAYPSASAPAVLLPEAALTDPDRRGTVEAALSRACAAAEPVLRDPAALAVDAVRHHLAMALAPGWLLVAGPPVTPRVPDGPPGRTLADHLGAACARHDMPEVRDRLRAWRAAAPGVPAGQVVVGPDGRLTPLVPAADPVDALRDLAATLTRAGHLASWPAPRDEAGLAGLLAAMAGEDVPVDPDPRPRVPVLADVVAERDRLARQLSEALARHTWYEQALTEREDLLKRNRRLVRMLSGTPTARAAATFVETARLARRALRRGR